MWVRLPPRAPVLRLNAKGLTRALFRRVPRVYPTRLVRFGVRMRQNERVLLPHTHHVCFELHLPRFIPRVVMALSNSHARMTQEHGHTLDWYSSLE